VGDGGGIGHAPLDVQKVDTDYRGDRRPRGARDDISWQQRIGGSE